MRYLVGRAWLKAFGWELEGVMPETKSAVFIASPHTSNWDLPFTLAVAWSMRMNLAWVGKKELFRFPFGGVMRMLGGVAVDRSKRSDFVQASASKLRESREGMYLVIAPSGTRRRQDHWKSGFYHIARAADVPLLLAYLDYGRRRGGILSSLEPERDVRSLMEKVRAHYRDIKGHTPAQASTPHLREEDNTADASPGA